MAITGSCLCETLRFEVEGPVTSMFHCHCSRCRKAHGAPFATYAMTPAQGFRWSAGEHEVVRWAGGQGEQRGFCPRCGAPSPGIVPGEGIAFFPVGLLDGDPGQRPQQHMFVGSRAPWFTITGSLPQHAAYPPEYEAKAVLPDLPAAPVADGRAAGSCLCGDVAYEFANPVVMFQCHCSRCRKSRGAAHGANLFCKLEDFRWVRGEARVVDYALPSARFFGVAFCGRCGGSVPRLAAARGLATVPAAPLDSDPLIRPGGHIFAGSKAPWYDITDTLPQHEEYPPGFSPPPRQ